MKIITVPLSQASPLASRKVPCKCACCDRCELDTLTGHCTYGGPFDGYHVVATFVKDDGSEKIVIENDEKILSESDCDWKARELG